MAIKSKDLAKMLGLSPASISLVLNNKPGVGEETRKRVLDTIRELGYDELLPDSPEQKQTILFLVYRKNSTKQKESAYFSQLFSSVIEGVENQIKQLGYQLMITYTDSPTIASEIEKIRSDKIDGLLLLATEMVKEQLDLFHNINIPVVVIDNYMESEDMDCVAINNEQGVDMAISHLVSKGHKEIGYLHIEDNANNFIERYDGFFRSFRENELQINSSNIISFSTMGGDTVYTELMDRIGKMEQMPTAFFADNDIIAVLAIRILREKGYRVPEDISIVGFDDISISELVDPPLTTVRTPKFEIGCVAVMTLASRIEGRSVGIQKIEMKTSLVERKSVITLL
ncbi:MAG: LacI family DNA-binding transcriptional regulator [Lachnospiraceae bacterium]